LSAAIQVVPKYARDRNGLGASRGHCVEKSNALRRAVSLYRAKDAYAMAASFLEEVSDTVTSELSSLIDDIVAILFEDDPTRFLKAHYVPVDGTNESLVTFEFDAIMFDAEFRAALRARGFELPQRGHIAHISHS